MDLAGIDGSEDTVIELRIETDSVLLQVLVDEQQQVGDEFSEVDGFVSVLAVAGIGEHAGGDFRGTLSGGEDLGEGFYPSRLVRSSQPHFCVVDHRGQDVVEFVRCRRGDRSDGAHFLSLPELFFEEFDSAGSCCRVVGVFGRHRGPLLGGRRLRASVTANSLTSRIGHLRCATPLASHVDRAVPTVSSLRGGGVG